MAFVVTDVNKTKTSLERKPIDKWPLRLQTNS